MSQLGEMVLMAVCSRDRHDSNCQVQALVNRKGRRTATSATRSAASFRIVVAGYFGLTAATMRRFKRSFDCLQRQMQEARFAPQTKGKTR